MKKKIILYIVAAISLAAGTLMFFIGFMMTGFDIQKLSTAPPYTEKIYVAQQDISSVYIHDENCRIILTPSADGDIHISYAENENNTYSISENNGKLTVEKKATVSWNFMLFSVSFYVPRLEVQIPADFSGDIVAITKNSSIYIDGISGETLECESKNGKIEIKNSVIANTLIAETSNSAINLDTVRARSMDLKTSNGHIELEAVRSDSDIFAETSNGKIKFYDVNFFGELNCKTSNAKIEGELKGLIDDYSYYCKTSNGSCSLPENMTAGDKKVTLRTSNGNIDVDFGY